MNVVILVLSRYKPSQCNSGMDSGEYETWNQGMDTLYLYHGLAATPLEASSGSLNIFFMFKYVYVAFDVYVLLNSLF